MKSDSPSALSSGQGLARRFIHEAEDTRGFLAKLL
jgi:hypothetical protein